MRTKDQAQSAEMQRLYEEEEWSLRDIARKFNMTHQGVGYRLEIAGVKRRLRGTGRRPRKINRDLLEKLHISDRLPVYKIATILKTSCRTVVSELNRHGITHHRYLYARYEPMDRLQVGEAVLLAPTNPTQPHLNFYSAARTRGIKISVKRVDSEFMEIRRVA